MTKSEIQFERWDKSLAPYPSAHGDVDGLTFVCCVLHTDSGFNSITITKLDVLSGLSELKVCVAYTLNGKKLESTLRLFMISRTANQFTKYVKGGNLIFQKIRKYGDLPREARKYIEFISKEITSTYLYCIRWPWTRRGTVFMIKISRGVHTTMCFSFRRSPLLTTDRKYLPRQNFRGILSYLRHLSRQIWTRLQKRIWQLLWRAKGDRHTTSFYDRRRTGGRSK